MARRVYLDANASVRVFGPTLDPLQVTCALRLPPDHTHRVGEPHLWRDGKGCVREGAPYQHGMWSISSERWVRSRRLAPHIVWLLDELEGRGPALAAFLDSGARADIFAYSRGATPHPPRLPRALHARAADLRLVIDIDHYDATAGGTGRGGTESGQVQA
jgi:hypothetical protein